MFRGFYINLARNETRRQALIQHLKAIGAAARYQRFEAVDGRAVASQYTTTLNPGELGVWLSDVQILDENVATDAHLHIIEDDTIFAANALTLFESLLNSADTQLGAWDLIFTDTFVPADLRVFGLFSDKLQGFRKSGAYTLIDLQRIAFACASSFFVNKASVRKVFTLLSGQWATGLPIDLYLRRLVAHGQLKALVTMPFMTSISRESAQSDIRGSLDRPRRVFDVLRRSFFVDANLPELFGEMHELTKGASVPIATELFLKVLGFTLSDQWTPF